MSNFYHYQIFDNETDINLIKLTTTRQLDPHDTILEDLAAAFCASLNLADQIARAQAGEHDREQGAK